MGVLSYFLEFLAFSLIIVSLGAVAVLFLYVVLMVNLKGYEIRESIFYKFNISSFLLSLLFLMVTIYLTRDDIQASYILDKVNHTEDEYGIPIVRYINVFDVVYRAFNSPLKLYGIILYDKFYKFLYLTKVYTYFCNHKYFLNIKIISFLFHIIYLVSRDSEFKNFKFFERFKFIGNYKILF